MKVKVTQSCPTLCNPMDCSPPGSSVYGILQARILEWVAIPSPGDLSDPRSKPSPFVSPAFAGGFFTTTPPEKPLKVLAFVFKSMVYFELIFVFAVRQGFNFILLHVDI